MLPRQSAHTILMVRPVAFGFNVQTAGTNLFQTRPEGTDPARTRVAAVAEFDQLVRRLRLAGVEVIVVADPRGTARPDAVFPNNWISFHPDGTVVIYPMYAPVRRLERRADVVVRLKSLYGFHVERVVDLTRYESEGRFLEGTGSLVYDHLDRVAYASISPRTHPQLVVDVATRLGYDPVVFRASDAMGRPIYHTNVLLSVGTDFAILCAEAIRDTGERSQVLKKLSQSRRSVIEIDFRQMEKFSANVIEIENADGAHVLAMSSGAHRALDPRQRFILDKHVEFVASSIPTIESVGGGSVRCMIAEVFLPRS